MSDFRNQLAKHYDAQALPAQTAEAILARGRAAQSGARTADTNPRPKSLSRPFWGVGWALAAALLIFAGLSGAWWRSDSKAVPFAALAPRLIEFFASKPQLAKAAQDKAELRDWLLARGAPADFQIPSSIAALESFACGVVDVSGQPTYLACFLREPATGGADVKLIHLLVARRRDFKDAPITQTPTLRELDGWSFASWGQGEVIYTLATDAPANTLQPFLADAFSRRLIAAQPLSVTHSKRSADFADLHRFSEVAWLRLAD